MGVSDLDKSSGNNPSVAWTPVYRCCWCQREFIQKEIAQRIAWVCPTPQCEERCRAWEILDVNGALFYLPMPKQTELEEAIASQQYGFITLGGARAGGKSYNIRIINYRYAAKIDNFIGFFLRREWAQLLRNHMMFAASESKRLGFKWANRTATFPQTMGIVEFGHCEDPNDFTNYVGAEADLVTFDQQEQFLEQQFTEISAAAGRRRRVGWRGLVLAGENPGGPLSAYINELYIDKTRDRVKYPQYRPEVYHFLTIDLEDNPYVDPQYTDNLAAIEPVKRDMYRFGRRDIFPGQYFKDFTHPQRIHHLDVPADYPRLGAFHWGYFKSGIMLWAVVLPDGRLYIERELVFEETIAAIVAARILSASRDFFFPTWAPGDPRNRIDLTHTFGNALGEALDAKVGEDVFETLYRAGFTVIRSEHDPVTGWQRLQHWFATPEGSPPALIVDPSCVTLIRTVPQLIQAPSDVEDVDEEGATAAAKALRYLVMARPQRTVPEQAAGARDLSTVDDKTRAEIERLRAYEAHEAGESDTIQRTDPGWPFGRQDDSEIDPRLA